MASAGRMTCMQSRWSRVVGWLRSCLICWSLAAVGVLAARAAAADDPRTPGTIRMATRLDQIARAVNPLNTYFLSDGQVPRLEQMMREHPELTNDVPMRFRYANALLNCGSNRMALAEYREVERLATATGLLSSGTNRMNLRLNIALCYLREGEQLNCLSNHNADSCLLPLRGGGIHRFPEPSRTAFGLLTQTLTEFPDSLAARWLLNIAAMTLGEYPGGVPPKWLIPESVFASKVPFPRFREVAPAVGLAANELSGASVVDDFDGDDRLDVIVTSFGLWDPMHFYHNDGNGTFSDRTHAAGLDGLVGGLNAIQADYDNDGHLDLFILRGAWLREEGKLPNSLLRNRGNGTFDDVTEAAGVLSFHPTQAAVWFDFDGDGRLDLFVGNEALPGVSRHPSELYHNRGDGTFVDVARASGVTVGSFVKGVVAGDFNNDGRPDLYVSILGGQNRLFRNDGPRDPARGVEGGWKFTDVAGPAGVIEPIDSFPCWFFDYDNDGWEDIWVSGYRYTSVADVAADYLGLPHHGTKMRLYRNRGDGTFADVSKEAGVDRLIHAMGANFGDFDNDGWLDAYLGTGDPDLLSLMPNVALRNDGGRRFVDVSEAGGMGHLQKGHGVSFADMDNDGDQDIHADMGGAVSGDIYPNVLFENPGFGNHWLKLRLEGTKANRSAIGARVRVEFVEAGKTRQVFRRVGSGGSFGANPLRLEIGLGKAERIVGAEIWWPGSGTHQTLTGLLPDHAYTLREGDAAAREVVLPKMHFPAGTEAAHAHP